VQSQLVVISSDCESERMLLLVFAFLCAFLAAEAKEVLPGGFCFCTVLRESVEFFGCGLVSVRME
jgi:hypothetical protein